MSRRAAALAAALLIGSCRVEAENLTNLGLGLDCSSGAYGSVKVTRACAFPAYLDIYRGNYELKMSVPWIRSRTGGDAVQGMGDASVYLAKALETPPTGLDELDVAGRVKLSNGDHDKALGSGHVDYQVEGVLVKSWGSNLVITYLGMTYTNAGHARNVSPYLTIWYKRRVSPDWKLGFMYENSDVIDARRAVRDVVFMPEYKASPRLTLRPLIYIGLTRNTADVGGGLTLICTLD